MELTLWTSIEKGMTPEVTRILRDNPTINVNWQNRDEYDYSGLHIACSEGHGAIVSLLLAHPLINVDQRTTWGATPFMVACWYGRTGCARQFLWLQNVNLNQRDSAGFSPLYRAACGGHIDIIRLWIMSARPLHLGETHNHKTDAVAVAKLKRNTAVVALLERFQADPVATRNEIADQLVSDVYAHVVFVADGLLRVRLKERLSPTARFFLIAGRLPLELQMTLCYRVLCSARLFVPAADSEPAFKRLARII